MSKRETKNLNYNTYTHKHTHMKSEMIMKSSKFSFQNNENLRIFLKKMSSNRKFFENESYRKIIVIEIIKKISYR